MVKSHKALAIVLALVTCLAWSVGCDSEGADASPAPSVDYQALAESHALVALRVTEPFEHAYELVRYELEGTVWRERARSETIPGTGVPGHASAHWLSGPYTNPQTSSHAIVITSNEVREYDEYLRPRRSFHLKKAGLNWDSFGGSAAWINEYLLCGVRGTNDTGGSTFGLAVFHLGGDEIALRYIVDRKGDGVYAGDEHVLLTEAGTKSILHLPTGRLDKSWPGSRYHHSDYSPEHGWLVSLGVSTSVQIGPRPSRILGHDLLTRYAYTGRGMVWGPDGAVYGFNHKLDFCRYDKENVTTLVPLLKRLSELGVTQDQPDIFRVRTIARCHEWRYVLVRVEVGTIKRGMPFPSVNSHVLVIDLTTGALDLVGVDHILSVAWIGLLPKP